MFRNMVSDGIGNVGLVVGLDDFRGPFQTKDSMFLHLWWVSSYCGCDVGVW